MIYKCGICEMEFSDYDKAKKHEEECTKPENMIKEIKELKKKIKSLEAEISFLKWTVPSMPPLSTDKYFPSKDTTW